MNSNIVIILGDKTQEIGEILDRHYKDSVTVVARFKTPTEFKNHYAEMPLRVNRIIISEDALGDRKIPELTSLRNALDSYFLKFDKCFILTSHSPEIRDLIDHVTEGFAHRDLIRTFPHEKYTHQLIIDYCLEKIAKRHHVRQETEYEDVVRRRIDGTQTFRLEEDEPDRDLVVLDRKSVQALQKLDKMSNMSSLASIVSDETWTNNKIIKDIAKMETALTVLEEEKVFEIDYSIFQLQKRIRTRRSNFVIVTGERRSGKTSMTYAVGRSFSTYEKVLLVDYDPKSLGLSYIAESVPSDATIIPLQEFRNNFQAALHTIVESPKNLNVIALNTRTIKELAGMNITNFISMIIQTCAKYFDKVIFDIPITEMTSIVPLFKKAHRIILTVPNSVNNFVSTFNILTELDIKDDLIARKVIFAPVDMFHHIEGIQHLTRQHCQHIVGKLFANGCMVLPPVQFGSFNLDRSLAQLLEEGIKDEN